MVRIREHGAPLAASERPWWSGARAWREQAAGVAWCVSVPTETEPAEVERPMMCPARSLYQGLYSAARPPRARRAPLTCTRARARTTHACPWRQAKRRGPGGRAGEGGGGQDCASDRCSQASPPHARTRREWRGVCMWSEPSASASARAASSRVSVSLSTHSDMQT